LFTFRSDHYNYAFCHFPSLFNAMTHAEFSRALNSKVSFFETSLTLAPSRPHLTRPHRTTLLANMFSGSSSLLYDESLPPTPVLTQLDPDNTPPLTQLDPDNTPPLTQPDPPQHHTPPAATITAAAGLGKRGVSEISPVSSGSDDTGVGSEEKEHHRPAKKPKDSSAEIQTELIDKLPSPLCLVLALMMDGAINKKACVASLKNLSQQLGIPPSALILGLNQACEMRRASEAQRLQAETSQIISSLKALQSEEEDHWI